MAAKTFYLKDAVPAGATLHRSLQDGGSAPTAATTTTGWNAGTNSIGQSCIQNGGSEVSRSNGQWSATLQPNAAPSQTVGDCWRSENTIDGTFANANWTFTFQIRSVTAAFTGRLKLAVRVWRSANQNGTGAVELSGGRVVSAATSANLSTSADTAVTVTWSPGAIKTLTAEYLFVNVGIEITSGGGGTTQDVDFRVGSTATMVTSDFGAAQTLTPGLYSNSATFHAPTVTPGAVTLTPSLFANTGAFYDPTVSASGGSQTLTQASTATNSATFYSATVTAGAVTLTPALATNAAAFYAATVTPGSVSLTPALLANASTFHTASVTPGTVTLSPTRHDNASDYYAATVGQQGGPQTVTQASRFDGSQTFHSPTLAPGAVTLEPGFDVASNQFYAPTVVPGTATLSATLHSNAEAFYTPTVSLAGGADQDLTVSLFVNAQAFHAPAVSAGNVLGPELLIGSNQFYDADVTAWTELSAELLANSNQFYAPLVSGGGDAVLQPPLFCSISTTFFEPRVCTIICGAPSRSSSSSLLLTARRPRQESTGQRP